MNSKLNFFLKRLQECKREIRSRSPDNNYWLCIIKNELANMGYYLDKFIETDSSDNLSVFRKTPCTSKYEFKIHLYPYKLYCEEFCAAITAILMGSSFIKTRYNAYTNLNELLAAEKEFSIYYQQIISIVLPSDIG